MMSKRVNNKKGNRASKRDFRQKTKVRGGRKPSSRVTELFGEAAK